ncbi:ferrous iron transport protein B [Sulfidibacter corallicola]|uniref:Ferrous iron transporter B n=1 Tax=Sulfidibacter corallicola TaxID=2818388 RepID=A0A8A4TPN4_SULCO|nr:ferrous iron transporter B [Sulfidibacter corallicola]QTD50871.1 ferrous iron transporter B [Sulfidibacter corallicola]
MLNPSPLSPDAAAAANAVGPRTVALVGSPNTGKSSLFSALCGLHQKVGNYPGVTVDKKHGLTRAGSVDVDILDLPGFYGLAPKSPDERVTVDALQGNLAGTARPDLLLFVAEATHLERHLPLFAEISRLGLPTVLVLTMADLLESNGIRLDLTVLSERLGVPVLPVNTYDAADVNKLRNILGECLAEPAPIEAVVAPAPEGDIADLGNRFRWSRDLIADVEGRGPAKRSFSQRLDRWLLHRFFGPVFFIVAMYLTFQAVYTWAGPLMDLIESAFAGLAAFAGGFLADMPMLDALVQNGLIGGVGSVVIFLPQILILFTFVAIMEDSGYLARVAFIMDKMLSWTGLNGRAFIPLLSGFACAIPAIMATRVMPDPKARLATILVTPLTSCSARLPVYLLLIGAFIEPHFGAGWAAFALFAMHALGLLLALPLAWFFNRGLLKTPPMPFVLEMPDYRMPRPGSVLLRSWMAGKTFLVQAGTIIFACSIVIWAMSYFPRPESVSNDIQTEYASVLDSTEDEEVQDEIVAEMENRIAAAYLEQSWLGRLGKGIEPVFQPLGFDWRISVGIISAFPAREVIVATLGIVYTVGEVDETSPGLKSALQSQRDPDGKPSFTPLTAIVLMVFFALCSQCMSTLATVKRELKSWKWPVFLFAYMTVLAYVCSLAIYQGGRLLGFG